MVMCETVRNRAEKSNSTTVIKGTSLSDADEKSAAMGKEVLAMIDKIM